MSSPYVGEIRLFAGNFAPLGWMFCDGTLLPISEYATLFQLIGTTYGGDGQNTFAVPNMSSRVPIHQSPNFVIGGQLGEESVAVTRETMPGHTHMPFASSNTAVQSLPGGYDLAVSSASSYGPAPGNSQMATTGVGAQGGSQAHDNMAPYVCLTYIISLFGIYPSQT